MPNVSVIGLGNLGRALAATLLEAGFDVTVWNRTRARATDLIDGGAIETPSVAEAVRASDLVLVCLLDHPATLATLNGPPLKDLTGRTVVQLSSGSPDEARMLEATVTTGGGAYLDGFVKAYPSSIGGTDAAVFCSGSRAAFARHRDTLGAIGRLTFIGEDVALASHLNNATAATMEIIVGAFVEAFAYAVSAGVPANDVIAMFPEAVRLATQTIHDAVAHWNSSPDGLTPAVEAAIKVHRSGLATIVSTILAGGHRADLAEAMLGYLEQACAQGLGDLEIAALLALHRVSAPEVDVD